MKISLSSWESFLSHIQKLRTPEGCAWNKEQTLETVAPYLLEETFEVLHAISTANVSNLKEELGDLYLVLTLLSSIAHERYGFSVDEILEEVTQKIIRRHPHVFLSPQKLTTQQVQAQWQAIKTQEKQKNALKKDLEKDPDSAVVPHSFSLNSALNISALEQSFDLQKKARTLGLDFGKIEEIFEKIQEEVDEIHEAKANNDPHNLEEELGDLLFSVINLIRHHSLHPSTVLLKANQKYEKRVKWIFEHLPSDITSPSKETLEELWKQSKQNEK